MNKYCVKFKMAENEIVDVFVYAVNRLMAQELAIEQTEEWEFKPIAIVDCVRMLEAQEVKI